MTTKFVITTYKRPQGRPPSTWTSAIKSDPKELEISWDEAIGKATKNYWKILINEKQVFFNSVNYSEPIYVWSHKKLKRACRNCPWRIRE